MSRTSILASVALVLVALTGRADAAGAEAIAHGLAATTGAKTITPHPKWDWVLKKGPDLVPAPTAQQWHDTFFGNKKDDEQTRATVPVFDAKVFNWRALDSK